MSGVPGRSRPNILLIVSDDHGYADRGPSSEFATPALDRLAAEGVTCTEAYVSAPICSPSRAGMITGRHQARWGARWFESSAMAPDDVPTLAELLGRRSYATGYFGKVHYGTTDAPGSRACPPRHGFDESFYGLSHFHKGRLNYLRRGEADATPTATRRGSWASARCGGAGQHRGVRDPCHRARADRIGALPGAPGRGSLRGD